MPRATGPKISDLKKELRHLREKECPPISKMKKAQVLHELEKHKGHLSGLAKVVEETKERNVERKKEHKREEAVHGLRKVEAETKERNAKRKTLSADEKYEKFKRDYAIAQEQERKDMEAGILPKGHIEYMEKMKKVKEASAPKKRKLRKAKVEESESEVEVPLYDVKPKVSRKQAHPKKYVAPEPEPAGPKKRKLNTPEAKKKRFEKGSAEAKEYMARLRNMKK
jgi:hypothetical protein